MLGAPLIDGRGRRVAGGVIAALAAVLALAACGGSKSTSSATTTSGQLPPTTMRKAPESIFTAGAVLKTNPVGTTSVLEALGVNRVRVFIDWNEVAPNAESPRRPNFDATNPAAYPAANWAVFDAVIEQVLAHHMALDVVLGPPPPRWASGPGAPHPATQSYWEPSAPEFEQFVKAVGTRYSGHYTPPGAKAPLPRVGFWSIWNEPNSGVQLAPQAIDDNAIEVAPKYYRQLVDAAWSGLAATGHGHDTTLIGELAPVGSVAAGSPGNFRVMVPLRFLRAMYCVGSDYRPLAGSAAAARGCPSTAAGSARFRAQNPGLFDASAYAYHPYTQGLPPDGVIPDAPDDIELAATSRLFVTLDRLMGVYGSHKRFAAYSTEFGYQTTPPDTQSGTVSPALAAKWLNWSEYLTWRDPRVLSYNQYLLNDPQPVNKGAYAGFASGLLTYTGTPKPGYAAYRLPVWLPVTSTAKGKPLEVWGCLRPAPYAERISHRTQRVSIQYSTQATGGFHTVETVPIAPASCYFDVRHAFPGSGFVRLAWSYPHGPAVQSRVTPITVG